MNTLLFEAKLNKYRVQQVGEANYQQYISYLGSVCWEESWYAARIQESPCFVWETQENIVHSDLNTPLHSIVIFPTIIPARELQYMKLCINKVPIV